MRTNVILAGKCHDHKSRHSAPSFRENVGSGENKSYQVLGIFISFSDRDRGWLPSTEISELTFVVKKKYNHDAVFRGVYQFMNDGQQRKPGNH